MVLIRRTIRGRFLAVQMKNPATFYCRNIIAHQQMPEIPLDFGFRDQVVSTKIIALSC